MTPSMLGITRRMAMRASRSSVLELRHPAEFHALCRAWTDLTRSSSCEGRWLGPGRYSLSGYDGDDGPVATVRRTGALSQQELDLRWPSGETRRYRKNGVVSGPSHGLRIPCNLLSPRERKTDRPPSLIEGNGEAHAKTTKSRGP